MYKRQGMYTGARDRFAKNEKGKYTEGEGKVTPVTLLHLNAGLTVHKFTYTLGIENLLNTTYYTVQSQLVARDTEYTHGNGRVITLSMTYRF
ncbi:TonB-dependent receptor [uncultured Porphyromonas sp.]|uniref:TonB-dependent receptor n=1 Tax=uncultured Porphyromonas sp. TaxID=159274 RepID=UPI00263195F6|nr:TonB-dependent receptor [uncultured Porphyromonas sp.]